MFSESSDKAVMDNTMLTYLQDGNQKGNEQEDKEVLEDAEEEDVEEKEDNVNGAKVIITIILLNITLCEQMIFTF